MGIAKRRRTPTSAMALTVSSQRYLDFVAARGLRSKRTQWHAWSALSEQIRLRNELWGPWQPQKLSAEDLHPRQVPSIDYTSAHVERHGLADLALMIAMAQAQAGGSARLCDRRTITTTVLRRAADRAANEHAAQPDFNSAAPPASSEFRLPTSEFRIPSSAEKLERERALGLGRCSEAYRLSQSGNNLGSSSSGCSAHCRSGQ